MTFDRGLMDSDFMPLGAWRGANHMDRPRLESGYFGSGREGGIYSRLAHVLKSSAHRHCPHWDINVVRIHPGQYQSAAGNQTFIWNTQKLAFWRDQVLGGPDGARLMLMDSDTLIVRPLDEVWALDFDVAYTVRKHKLPLNGGVVFVRISERTRRFFDVWWKTNLRFLGSKGEHKPWRLKYAGINQAALGHTLEKADHGCSVLKLPCNEWNLCDFEKFDAETTRIIHIKDHLRRMALSLYPVPHPTAKMLKLVQLWKEAERLASREEKKISA